MKPMVHKSELCKTFSPYGQYGEFIVHYDDDNIPFLKCSECQKTIDDWRRWKDTYSSYWMSEEKWNSKRDHIMCLLGYFTELYKKHYGIEFTFSLNESGLFRGKEVFCIRRMYAMLGADAQISKEYIDWIFEVKIIKKKRRVTSLGLLCTSELVQEYKLCRQKSKRIVRSRPIPEKMILWINQNAPEVLSHVSLRDFGELKMALIAYREGHFDSIGDFKIFTDRLLYNNVIDSDMNIVGWSD